MFEITKNDNEALEYYINEGMAYENAEYDFTFEHRFIIYHAPLCNQVRYFALDRKTNLSSEVCRRPSGAFLDYEFKTLIDDRPDREGAFLAIESGTNSAPSSGKRN